MTLENFIPEIWSANLLSNLNEAHVYADVVNRDYEGEIKQAGDTVRINSIGRVTIGNYTKNVNIGDPETLTDSQKTLFINQQKFFNFQIDDVDKAQQSPKVMSEAMRESAYGLSRIVDLFLGGFYTGADAANLIGSDVTPTVVTAPAAAYELLVDLGVILDNANAPTQGRNVVVPPWFYALLLKDQRFVGAGTAATDAVLRNGMVGSAANFTVVKSNNVANTAGVKYKIQASVKSAVSYAEQIVSVEGYRPQQRFADAVKGLHVYGGSLIRSSQLAVLTANKS